MMNKLDKKWQLKIICLLMAIVLWFFIINEQNPMSEGSYTVPIVVENLDSQYITSNVPKTVYVRLSGPRNTIINVGPSDIKAYIDLSDAQEGEMSAPVRIEIPAGTELKKQSMTSADIMVDVYTVRELALTPHLVGQTKNDIFVSSLKVVPEKVVISGARRLVKQVEQAVVEIPIEDRIDDFSIMAPIRLVAADGSRVEGLEMTPWQSNIRISIGHNAVTKDIPVYVTTEGDVSPSVSLKEIKINPDTVAVKGDANILKNLSRIDLPPIDISGLKQDKKWKIIVSPVNGVIFEPDTIEVAVDVE
ncbi:YbbR-like domain-containing protein [Megasphaera stantonii]|jgi:YbbR domain-containing protein|uniref:CdaR family protein n=1 Tax=Megasphaera stantonii TaxID=2144175 RepID=UPI0023F2F511|nr:CdaR family protein [Megasphaera stantonii]MDN0047751.1 CdaR family protein [Megasphaera hexanoica]